MKCLICGKRIKNGHGFDKQGLLDDAHKKAVDTFHGLEGKCVFCGDHVSTTRTGQEGYFTECNGCGFLYDED